MTLTLAIVGSNAVILGIAIIIEQVQERGIRRRLRPADRARVDLFLASRRAEA